MIVRILDYDSVLDYEFLPTNDYNWLIPGCLTIEYGLLCMEVDGPLVRKSWISKKRSSGEFWVKRLPLWPCLVEVAVHENISYSTAFQVRGQSSIHFFPCFCWGLFYPERLHTKRDPCFLAQQISKKYQHFFSQQKTNILSRELTSSHPSRHSWR